jgi:hypothetical protein
MIQAAFGVAFNGLPCWYNRPPAQLRGEAGDVLQSPASLATMAAALLQRPARGRRRWYEQRPELLQSLASLAPMGRRHCYKRWSGGVAARDHAYVFSGDGAVLLERCVHDATGSIRALLPRFDRDATGNATDGSRCCCKGMSVMLPTVAAAVAPRLRRRCEELPKTSSSAMSSSVIGGIKVRRVRIGDWEGGGWETGGDFFREGVDFFYCACVCGGRDRTRVEYWSRRMGTPNPPGEAQHVPYFKDMY